MTPTTAADVRRLRERKAALIPAGTEHTTKGRGRKGGKTVAKAAPNKGSKRAATLSKAKAVRKPKAERIGIECSCGCGGTTKFNGPLKNGPRLFLQGHDARAFGLVVKVWRKMFDHKGKTADPSEIKPILIERFVSGKLIKLSGDSRVREVMTKLTAKTAVRKAA